MEYRSVRLEVLTPVHVGTGTALDPLSYVIKGQDGQPWLHGIDLPAWVEDQNDPAALAETLGKADPYTLRQFVAERVDVDAYSLSRSKVHSREIADEYALRLGDRLTPNQLKISPHVRNPLTCAPFVPGSSVKGAIRTAVIDYLDRKHGLHLKEAKRQDDRERRRGRGHYTAKLEEALGRIGDNDFRKLKISDFEGGADDSWYVTAVEVGLNPKKSPTPKDPCEVIPGFALSGRRHILYGRVGIGSSNGSVRDSSLSIERGRIREKWNLEDLMGICDEFFLLRYRNESEKFYSRPHLAHVGATLGKIDGLIGAGGGGTALRIGRYSHIECVTITDNDPEVRLIRDERLPFGVTRTLAGGLLPFGWVRLTACSEEEYLEQARNMEHKARDARKTRAALRARLQAAAAERERERLEREHLRRQAEEEEAKIRMEIESMAEDERLLFLLRRGELDENGVVKLYQLLDGMESGNRLDVAGVLREYWRSVNKWEKKDCSIKQSEKVRKIKEILGEL